VQTRQPNDVVRESAVRESAVRRSAVRESAVRESAVRERAVRNGAAAWDPRGSKAQVAGPRNERKPRKDPVLRKAHARKF
jgi:hypothetical protein